MTFRSYLSSRLHGPAGVYDELPYFWTAIGSKLRAILDNFGHTLTSQQEEIWLVRRGMCRFTYSRHPLLLVYLFGPFSHVHEVLRAPTSMLVDTQNYVPGHPLLEAKPEDHYSGTRSVI